MYYSAWASFGGSNSKEMAQKVKRGAQKVKRGLKRAPMQETRGSIPGSEDPLEREMAILSSILAWRI